MKIISFIYFFILNNIISGCSFLSNKIESLENKNVTQINYRFQSGSQSKKLYCFENNYEQYYFEDDIVQNFYAQNFINNFKNLTFIQKSILFSFIEMLRRPDTSGPFSRLQVFIRLDKDYYFDFRPNDLSKTNTMPYIYGLENIYNFFAKKDNFKIFIKKINPNIPKNLPVSFDFEIFLRKHKNEILKNENLNPLYTKGDETLTKNETFISINISQLLNEYYTNHLNNIDLYSNEKKPLIPSKKDINLFCNFDLNSEINKDDIFNYDKKDTHPIAYKDGNNIFIAIASTINDSPIKTSTNTNFLKNKSSPSPVPFCRYENDKMNLITFSTMSRDPSQHLKHLFQYEIMNSDSFPTLMEYLNFPRHLFLSTPERILYESKKGRKAQLDYLLSMNFPIYHVDSIGNIFGIASFKNPKKDTSFNSLFIDERNNFRLWCGK